MIPRILVRLRHFGELRVQLGRFQMVFLDGLAPVGAECVLVQRV